MNTHKAYAHGALDAYNCGEYNNPYDKREKQDEYQAYRNGYFYGFFLYTRDNTPGD